MLDVPDFCLFVTLASGRVGKYPDYYRTDEHLFHASACSPGDMSDEVTFENTSTNIHGSCFSHTATL